MTRSRPLIEYCKTFLSLDTQILNWAFQNKLYRRLYYFIILLKIYLGCVGAEGQYFVWHLMNEDFPVLLFASNLNFLSALRSMTFCPFSLDRKIDTQTDRKKERQTESFEAQGKQVCP